MQQKAQQETPCLFGLQEVGPCPQELNPNNRGSVLARVSYREQCFLRDQSIAVVLIAFFQPHQKEITAEERYSLARTLK